MLKLFVVPMGGGKGKGKPGKGKGKVTHTGHLGWYLDPDKTGRLDPNQFLQIDFEEALWDSSVDRLPLIAEFAGLQDNYLKLLLYLKHLEQDPDRLTKDRLHTATARVQELEAQNTVLRQQNQEYLELLRSLDWRA